MPSVMGGIRPYAPHHNDTPFSPHIRSQLSRQIGSWFSRVTLTSYPIYQPYVTYPFFAFRVSDAKKIWNAFCILQLYSGKDDFSRPGACVVRIHVRTHRPRVRTCVHFVLSSMCARAAAFAFVRAAALRRQPAMRAEDVLSLIHI